MMRDPNANFYEIQDAFNTYWEGKTIEKGKGYKAFKRWEYYMAPRVYPSGDLTLPSQTYRNYKQWELDLIQAGTPKSTNGNWTIIGPIGKPTGGGAGRLNFVRFDPTNSNTIWVGAPDGGLWKTTNGGTSWTTNTDQLSMIGVSDVAIDPTNTQIMYLATGDSDGGDTYSIGVLKSTDGGATWNTTGLTWATTLGRTIGRLLINPTNPNIIMAFSSAGIFRSTNGGTSWSNPTGSFTTSDAEFKPGDPNTVYACGTSFKRSTDGGASWTAVTLPLTANQRLAVAVSPANSAYVYVLGTGNDFGYRGLMRSTNSGAAFTTMSTTPNVLGFDNGGDTGGQGWYDLAVAVSPTNAEEVIVGGINHWRSTNGGSTWTMISHWFGGYSKPYVHADVHDIQFLPGSSTTIFSANDGGIFKTTNNGSSWTDLSANLAIAQQYRMSLSTSSATMILAGHQDNGTNRTTNGTSWTEVGGGDGMDCFIDRTNNNRQIASIYYGDYSRTTTGATNFADIADPGVQGDWVSPIKQDPVDANIAYAAGRPALYKTSNIWASSVTWTTMGTPAPSANSIIEFAIAPSNNQVIYVLKQGTGGISKSTNGGSTFTSCATPTTAASPSWVAVSNTDPNVVFVTYSGYSSANKVFKSTNGGTSWTNISTGLPNIPVNCIVYHNGAAGGDGVYIGTDLGVFYRDNGTNTWIDFSSGMPNCAVTDLEIYYATGRLRAATYGRGTWDSDLYSAVPTLPTASFVANATTVCEGSAVTFTNTSSGLPTSYSWTFQGGSPATSTATNPVVTYNTAGTYTVELTATNASGSNTQTSVGYITVIPVSGQALPLTEGFAGTTFPPTGWTIINENLGDTTWRRSATYGVTPTAGNSMWFDNFNVNDIGNSDEMRTPKLNFTGLSSAQLTFSVAYAAYSATYVDGLEVGISTDCGTTWNTVYSKGGATVAAGNLPTANAQTTIFLPTATQWRTETVDLTTYIGQNGVILAFRNIAGYGNALYVDNINITGVAAPTPPTASFTSSPSGSACAGQVVQFNNTSTGNPTSYSWTFPGGSPATSTAQNPTVSWATAGTYTVTMVATNSNGSNTTTQTITVNPNPVVTQTPFSAVCSSGAPVTLTGGSPSGGTYSGTGVTGGVFDPAVAGAGNTVITYTVTQSGCTGTTSAPITVNASPSITSTTPGNICGSGTVTLSATPSAGTATWYTVPSGGTSVGTGNTYTTPVLSATTTYYVETTASGCTSTRVPVVATVNTAPTVTNPGSQTYCTGTATQSIVFSGSNPSSSYSWTNTNTGIGLAASGTGNISSFVPATAGTATIVVTPSLNGCAGAPQNFVITVNATPSIVSTTPGSVCGSGTVNLVATPSAGTATWYTSPTGGSSVGSGNSFTTPVLTATTTYYVETTSGGCTSPRIPVVATVNSAPTVNNPGSQNYCTGTATQPVVFSGSSGSATYTWVNDNAALGIAASGTGSIGSFTPANSGIANITVTPDLNGCVGTPQTFMIVVSQTPAPTQAPFSTVCENWSPFTLTGGSPAGGIYSGTGVSGGQFDPSVSGAGTFPITYSFTQNGCTGSATASITVDACASLSETVSETILIYPNPATEKVTISGINMTEYTSVSLYDAAGRHLSTWNVTSETMLFDLKELSSGTYTLRFSGNSQDLMRRIEVLRQN
jgi:PKD repeat protein